MKIIINQEEKEIPENTTISKLLEILDMDKKTGIAVAVGMEIIQKDNWATIILKQNDTINIITASQGG